MEKGPRTLLKRRLRPSPPSLLIQYNTVVPITFNYNIPPLTGTYDVTVVRSNYPAHPIPLPNDQVACFTIHGQNAIPRTIVVGQGVPHQGYEVPKLNRANTLFLQFHIYGTYLSELDIANGVNREIAQHWRLVLSNASVNESTRIINIVVVESLMNATFGAAKIPKILPRCQTVNAELLARIKNLVNTEVAYWDNPSLHLVLNHLFNLSTYRRRILDGANLEIINHNNPGPVTSSVVTRDALLNDTAADGHELDTAIAELNASRPRSPTPLPILDERVLELLPHIDFTPKSIVIDRNFLLNISVDELFQGIP